MDLPTASQVPLSSTSSAPNIKEQALELTQLSKFHRKFTLPGTSTHGELQVSYSIAGPDIGDDAPTILFCGGMFGMRWMAVTQNWFAEQNGVRMISVDRPGFGDSTPVPISRRISIFLETVIALLAELQIPHIALAAQSAGTIYALNIIAHHPDLLSPSDPTLTLFSPWVHQSISGNLGLKAAAKLPNISLDYWNTLVGGIITKGGPALNHSSGILTSVTKMFTGGGNVSPVSSEGLVRAAQEKRCRERYGISPDLKAELVSTSNALCWGESTVGGNDEARICLKSCPGTGWDRCEVYPTFVRELKLEWGDRVARSGHKLKIRIAFGEGEDSMVGWKGMQYFEDCFTKEKLGRGIEVEKVVQKGADHDSIVDPGFDEILRLFESVKEGWKKD
ncbi:hypothetical protein LZ554_007883 [Drepanopeziza brunnea f. sp. 'monogermtubi']|nr:hypothetical protein LZ554_007883 [Drepanopeziza brunnea f. sp. 'monogermtubi']